MPSSCTQDGPTPGEGHGERTPAAGFSAPGAGRNSLVNAGDVGPAQRLQPAAMTDQAPAHGHGAVPQPCAAHAHTSAANEGQAEADNPGHRRSRRASKAPERFSPNWGKRKSQANADAAASESQLEASQDYLQTEEESDDGDFGSRRKRKRHRRSSHWDAAAAAAAAAPAAERGPRAYSWVISKSDSNLNTLYVRVAALPDFFALVGDRDDASVQLKVGENGTAQAFLRKRRLSPDSLRFRIRFTCMRGAYEPLSVQPYDTLQIAFDTSRPLEEQEVQLTVLQRAENALITDDQPAAGSPAGAERGAGAPAVAARRVYIKGEPMEEERPPGPKEHPGEPVLAPRLAPCMPQGQGGIGVGGEGASRRAGGQGGAGPSGAAGGVHAAPGSGAGQSTGKADARWVPRAAASAGLHGGAWLAAAKGNALQASPARPWMACSTGGHAPTPAGFPAGAAPHAARTGGVARAPAAAAMPAAAPHGGGLTHGPRANGAAEAAPVVGAAVVGSCWAGAFRAAEANQLAAAAAASLGAAATAAAAVDRTELHGSGVPPASAQGDTGTQPAGGRSTVPAGASHRGAGGGGALAGPTHAAGNVSPAQPAASLHRARRGRPPGGATAAAAPAKLSPAPVSTRAPAHAAPVVDAQEQAACEHHERGQQRGQPPQPEPASPPPRGDPQQHVRQAAQPPPPCQQLQGRPIQSVRHQAPPQHAQPQQPAPPQQAQARQAPSQQQQPPDSPRQPFVQLEQTELEEAQSPQRQRPPSPQQQPELRGTQLPQPQQPRPTVPAATHLPASSLSPAHLCACLPPGVAPPPLQPGELRLCGLTFHPSVAQRVRDSVAGARQEIVARVQEEGLGDTLEDAPADTHQLRLLDVDLARQHGLEALQNELRYSLASYLGLMDGSTDAMSAERWELRGVERYAVPEGEGGGMAALAAEDLRAGAVLGIPTGFVLPRPAANRLQFNGFKDCPEGTRRAAEARFAPEALLGGWRLLLGAHRLPYSRGCSAGELPMAGSGGSGIPAGAAASDWDMSMLGYGNEAALIADPRVAGSGAAPNTAMLRFWYCGLVLPVVVTTVAVPRGQRLLRDHGAEWWAELSKYNVLQHVALRRVLHG